MEGSDSDEYDPFAPVEPAVEDGYEICVTADNYVALESVKQEEMLVEETVVKQEQEIALPVVVKQEEEIALPVVVKQEEEIALPVVVKQEEMLVEDDIFTETLQAALEGLREDFAAED